MKKRGLFLLYMTIVLFATLCLNYLFLEKIIIGDPCVYHVRNTGFIFNLFYDTPAFNGGHPFPTLFNFIFTACAGILTGWVSYSRFRKENNIIAWIYSKNTK